MCKCRSSNGSCAALPAHPHSPIHSLPPPAIAVVHLLAAVPLHTPPLLSKAVPLSRTFSCHPGPHLCFSLPTKPPSAPQAHPGLSALLLALLPLSHSSQHILHPSPAPQRCTLFAGGGEGWHSSVTQPGVPCTPWGCISSRADLTLVHVPHVVRAVPAVPTTPMGAGLQLSPEPCSKPSRQTHFQRKNPLLHSHQIL